ncbi:MAG: Hsp20/alpha crystallin family protein [Methylococcaceae bacterium]|jgi:HSP20 family protein
MKNSVVIIIGVLLLFAFGMQVFMFYRIHEKLDQRFALEKNLNLSSHQGSDTWIQDSDNWNPYEELLQMRNQMEQLFNGSMSRLHKDFATDSFTKMPAIDLKDEKDRYVVTADIPGADESSLDVALKGRELTISIKTENVNEETDAGNVKEQTGGNNKYQLRERFSGEFKRSLTLPGAVNQAGMKTKYDKGVLTITLPKT